MGDETTPTVQTETTRCPHCGAPVTYPRGAASAQCAYCGQSFDIPGTSGAWPFGTRRNTAGTGHLTARQIALGALLYVGPIVLIILILIVYYFVITPLLPR